MALRSPKRTMRLGKVRHETESTPILDDPAVKEVPWECPSYGQTKKPVGRRTARACSTPRLDPHRMHCACPRNIPTREQKIPEAVRLQVRRCSWTISL